MGFWMVYQPIKVLATIYEYKMKTARYCQAVFLWLIEGVNNLV